MSQQKQPDMLENGLNKKNSISEPTTANNGNNGRISKLSMLSGSVGSPSGSGAQKSPSVVSNVATSLSSDLKKKVEAEVSNQAKAALTNTMDYASKNVQNGAAQMVGSALNISSDFKGVSNMANKAMAIVQPTENNDTHSSAYAEAADKLASDVKDDAAKLGSKMAQTQHELLQQQQRTISRSVSDLSGKQKQIVAESMGVEIERVTALEEIFNGSAPNLTNIKNGADKDKTSKVAQKGGQQSSDLAHLSVSSLESIELPETLVESIKQTNSKNATGAATVEQPSPNLLLGQVAATSGAEVAANNSGEAQKEQVKRQDSNANKAAKSGVSSSTAGGKQTKQSNTDFGSKSAKATVDPPTKSSSSKTTKQKDGGEHEESQNERPANPMGRESANQSKSADTKSEKKLERGKSRQNVHHGQADVKNHQVVVNKLDKRKTNLEIVDLRDASVAGNLVNNNKKTSSSNKNEDEKKTGLGGEDSSSGWISMDGVAVVGNQTATGSLIGLNSSATALGQAPNSSGANNISGQQEAVINQQQMIMSPSDIIESRFNVDYKANKKNRVAQQTNSTQDGTNNNNSKNIKNMESIDSNQEEYILNNIENELEQDNRMKNRKYFVYIVHDGHFTAKKECIARIELPQKRRITLAEVRQLISNSQDISLSSLRRSKFKFVTETYRLLNENEDAAVLHQVYPTQGVFLKLNIPEQENPIYPFKGHTSRLSSSGSNQIVSSSLSQTTISSRRRANVRNNVPSAKDNNLPAIEVDYASGGTSGSGAMSYGRMRTSSVGRRTATGSGATSRDSGRQQPLSNYRRSKSSVQVGRQRGGGQQQAGMGGRKQSNLGDKLPAIGRYRTARETTIKRSLEAKVSSSSPARRRLSSQTATTSSKSLSSSPLPTLSNAATDLGNKVISGAKGLFNATFHR